MLLCCLPPFMTRLVVNTVFWLNHVGVVRKYATLMLLSNILLCATRTFNEELWRILTNILSNAKLSLTHYWQTAKTIALIKFISQTLITTKLESCQKVLFFFEQHNLKRRSSVIRFSSKRSDCTGRYHNFWHFWLVLAPDCIDLYSVLQTCTTRLS